MIAKNELESLCKKPGWLMFLHEISTSLSDISKKYPDFEKATDIFKDSISKEIMKSTDRYKKSKSIIRN